MPSTGTPASKIACGARGDVASVIEAGPPERITPRGFIVGEGFSRLLEGDDLAIDPLLAHASGDELGDLGAEIDDENLVVGCHGEQLADRPGGRNRLSHSYLLFEL